MNMNEDVKNGFDKIEKLTKRLFSLVKYTPHAIKVEDKKYSNDSDLSGILTIETCCVYPIMKVAQSITGAFDYVEWGIDCGCAVTGDIIEEVCYKSEYDVAKHIALKVMNNQFNNILEGIALSDK